MKGDCDEKLCSSGFGVRLIIILILESRNFYFLPYAVLCISGFEQK